MFGNVWSGWHMVGAQELTPLSLSYPLWLNLMRGEKSTSLWLGPGGGALTAGQLPQFLAAFLWAWLPSSRMLLSTQGQGPQVMTSGI